MKRWVGVLMFGLVVACGGNSAESAAPATPASEHGHHDEHHGAKPSGGPVKAPGEAEVGDTTRCPVSGEEFVVEATSPKVEHAGKTYYLCCGGCKKKFEENPEKFLNKS
ncbi:MAG: YHS domain-containing protein [Labilithrix sp.]|nr:YHS domain-containing protein [Labilithrix sp.]MBX3220820.1 YHS domain-containing protein [Labilithrix sp.]